MSQSNQDKIDCPWCHNLHDDDSCRYGYCGDKCRKEAYEEEQPFILDWIAWQLDKKNDSA